MGNSVEDSTEKRVDYRGPGRGQPDAVLWSSE